jgi:hypothetical protein
LYKRGVRNGEDKLQAGFSQLQEEKIQKSKAAFTKQMKENKARMFKNM